MVSTFFAFFNCMMRTREICIELFTFLWYNVSTSLGLNIFIGVCCLKNTNLMEIVA